MIRKKLGVRIVLYLLVVVVVFGLFMVYYIYRNNDLRSKSETNLYRIHGRTLIRNFASSVTLFFGLQNRNAEELSKEAGKLFKDPTVSYVVFYDEDSKLVFEKYRDGLEPEKFKFPTPSWNNENDEIITKDITSKTDEPFIDFCTLVKMAQEFPVAAAEDSVSAGWVRIGISLDTLARQLRHSRIEGYALIGTLLFLGLLLVLVILRTVMPPINRLAQAAKLIGRGKFDVQVEVTSEDEIGLLGMTFNEMVSNIRRQTARSKSLIENIAQAVELLGGSTSRLFVITSQQSSGATEQASVVQEVVSTTSEIASTAARIADSSASVSQAAQQTSEVCNKGKDYITGSISGMNQIHDQVEKVTEQIMDLSEQAQQIGSVINVIEEISEQTNLLSLNAALEAVGAGEVGRRFRVVATEVRRLANRTLEFTESVKEVVENIQKSTGTMVEMGEEQKKVVADGTKSVERMGDYFGHILDMVESTRQASSEIKLVTQQQTTASDQMVTSIREVEEIALQVEKGVKEIESLVKELKTLADHLKVLIEEKDE